MKKRKGFSLVEVVVAIALIALMSTMTFSVIQCARNITLRSEIRLLASNTIENVAKCYYLSGENEDFQAYLKKLPNNIGATNTDLPSRNPTPQLYVTSDFVITTQENAIYRIEFEFHENETIYASVKNISTDAEIYSYGERTLLSP